VLVSHSETASLLPYIILVTISASSNLISRLLIINMCIDIQFVLGKNGGALVIFMD
jgi:hypothetical protein